MSNSIDDYRKRVEKHLSRPEQQPVLEVAAALCYPSFHPETLLRACRQDVRTARRQDDKTTFRLVTLIESLWHSKLSNPELIEEVAEAPVETARRFWQAIADLDLPTIRVEKSLGLDGMSISVVHTCGDTMTSFETWSPDPGSPEGKFVALLYSLGWELLKEQASIQRLEQLHGYLRLGLPARVIHGEVATLRLFGILSSNEARELRQLFASIPPGTPLVLDMTNFEGMGTLLYPIFAEFATRHPIIGWAASAIARRQIEEMQLVEPHVFDSTADAVEWLLGRTNQPKSWPGWPRRNTV
ncbi:MAG TPA: hypothetical protein VMV10_13075 [Pirellulales bacterium]|nr:hypothetical protein [Pirellulales bacterium]